MKVIITGGTGFIGRNLATRLHEDGMKVLATGRSTEVGDKLQKQSIDFDAADILDRECLKEVFTPADCVIHCAGHSGDWGRYEDFHAANVHGTRNVIAACRRHAIPRLIFVSSPSVYYDGSDRLDIDEDAPLPGKPASAYARTKRLAEAELRRLSKEGSEVIILRPRAVYGPYDNTILPRILKLSEKRSFPLINDGRALVDITYIDNFVGAVRQCLAAGAAAWNQTYNISNGQPITLKAWFDQILTIFERPFNPKNIPLPMASAVAAVMEILSRLPFGPRQPSMTRFSVGYMARSMTLSVGKARRLLGYAPSVDNQESFARYRQWYRQQHPTA